MIAEWTDTALADVERLYLFLAAIDTEAAIQAANTLSEAPNGLTEFPRVGERLEGFENRELRRVIIGKYKLRYEILDDVISIVRVFHGREDRSFGPE